MKKYLTPFLLVAVASLAISFSSCKSKPKDADIKAAIETALKADPMSAGTMVAVDKGVATISGECKDDMCKTHCAELVKGIKGVKEVVNNCTIAAPPPPPMATDAAVDVLSQGLTDALKDHPGVTGTVENGKIVLKGEIAKAKWAMIKQTLDKLKPAGYELSGLKIK
ncbi:MAG: BON domain-containing protein [Chitinophagaceae bacterium]